MVAEMSYAEYFKTPAVEAIYNRINEYMRTEIVNRLGRLPRASDLAEALSMEFAAADPQFLPAQQVAIAIRLHEIMLAANKAYEQQDTAGRLKRCVKAVNSPVFHGLTPIIKKMVGEACRKGAYVTAPDLVQAVMPVFDKNSHLTDDEKIAIAVSLMAAAMETCCMVGKPPADD